MDTIILYSYRVYYNLFIVFKNLLI